MSQEPTDGNRPVTEFYSFIEAMGKGYGLDLDQTLKLFTTMMICRGLGLCNDYQVDEIQRLHNSAFEMPHEASPVGHPQFASIHGAFTKDEATRIRDHIKEWIAPNAANFRPGISAGPHPVTGEDCESGIRLHLPTLHKHGKKIKDAFFDFVLEQHAIGGLPTCMTDELLATVLSNHLKDMAAKAWIGPEGQYVFEFDKDLTQTSLRHIQQTLEQLSTPEYHVMPRRVEILNPRPPLESSLDRGMLSHVMKDACRIVLQTDGGCHVECKDSISARHTSELMRRLGGDDVSHTRHTVILPAVSGALARAVEDARRQMNCVSGPGGC